MEKNGRAVNLGKTKVMKCEARSGLTQNSVKWSLRERHWFQ
jgi:hypothetical protein